MSKIRLPNSPFSDPRHYQILSLMTLLCFGVLEFEFSVTVARVITILTTVLLTQFYCSRFYGLPNVEYRSALISGLSLSLLMRTSSEFIAVAVAVITILSKFTIRFRGKHVFNPTNFGIASAILLGAPVWISPGQWGSTPLIFFLVICLGSSVVFRAKRSDVTFAFLAFHAGFLLVRAITLGDPLVIPFHQLENGALLIFAFFMISDPKTIPNSRGARIFYAFLVAALGYYIRFKLFNPNALLYALVFLSPIVPLIDLLFPGNRYEWQNQKQNDPLKVLKPVSV